MSNKEVLTDLINENSNDAGVTVEGVKNKDGRIQLVGQATPATPPSGKVEIYPKADNKLYFKDSAGVEHMIAELTGGEKSVFRQSAQNGNYGNYSVQTIGANGIGYMVGYIPHDFNTLTEFTVCGIITAGAAGSGKDIDFYLDFAADGEDYQTHQLNDVTSVYDLTGKTDQVTCIHLESWITGLSASDRFGLQIDHNLIGNSIHYLGIEIKYTI